MSANASNMHGFLKEENERKKTRIVKIDLGATTLVWLKLEINAFYSLLFVSMSFVQICERMMRMIAYKRYGRIVWI